jgi:hypothetical protein
VADTRTNYRRPPTHGRSPHWSLDDAQSGCLLVARHVWVMSSLVACIERTCGDEMRSAGRTADGRDTSGNGLTTIIKLVVVFFPGTTLEFHRIDLIHLLRYTSIIKVISNYTHQRLPIQTLSRWWPSRRSTSTPMVSCASSRIVQPSKWTII